MKRKKKAPTENKAIYDAVIDNIKMYRRQRGLTQQGLALRANMSKGYLSQIEAKNYGRFCSMEMLINIADALDISLCDLLTISEEDEKSC